MIFTATTFQGDLYLTKISPCVNSSIFVGIISNAMIGTALVLGVYVIAGTFLPLTIPLILVGLTRVIALWLIVITSIAGGIRSGVAARNILIQEAQLKRNT